MQRTKIGYNNINILFQMSVVVPIARRVEKPTNNLSFDRPLNNIKLVFSFGFREEKEGIS